MWEVWMAGVQGSGGGKWGKGRKQEGFSGTCIKDTWTKPKRSRIKGRKWGLLGWRGAVGGKWRQLYLSLIHI